MMKAAPVTAFVVTKTDLLLEFQVVALDAPAHLYGGHQIVERDVSGQGAQMIVNGLVFAFRPFDEKPFLGTRLIAVRGAHAYAGEARGKSRVGAFAPPHRAIALRRQRARQF